jgi:hypothetical protein
MALVSDLVDEVIDVAHSYVRDQEQATTLTAILAIGGLTLTVSDATQVSRGLIEVGNELMWASEVDTANNLVTIEPWGRAQSGTTAVEHAINTRVTNSPSFPRQRVLNILSDVIQEIFPDVCAVTEQLLDYTGTGQTNFTLASDCYHVLTVDYLAVGPSGAWVPIDRYRQTKRPTSCELQVINRVPTGTGRIRVTYVKSVPTPVALTDDLETLGYGNGVRGLLILGAVARLMAFVESSRVQSSAVESAARSESVPPGSASSLSRYLYQLFRQRLEDEARQLRVRFPSVPHYTR